MSLESYCAACTYLGERADYNGKYYCQKKGEDHYATDPKCYSFVEAYSRSNSARENMYSNSQSHSGSGCYLTTIMCEILGYPDNNYYLNTLRKFRDNTMKTNPNYFPLLYLYDFVGPLIADKLSKDQDKVIIAKTFFQKYIKESVDAIKENKEKSAINIYKSMTYALAEKYNINLDLLSPIQVPKHLTTNPSVLGHGKIRKLMNENA